jgi:hypothetical protein
MEEEVQPLIWIVESEKLLPICTLQRVLDRVLPLRVIVSEKQKTVRKVHRQKAKARNRRAASEFARRVLHLHRCHETATHRLHLHPVRAVPVRVLVYEKVLQVPHRVRAAVRQAAVRQAAAHPVRAVPVQAPAKAVVQTIAAIELENEQLH